MIQDHTVTPACFGVAGSINPEGTVALRSAPEGVTGTMKISERRFGQQGQLGVMTESSRTT